MTRPSFEASASSPVNKIPYNVLREIFIHSLPRFTIQRVDFFNNLDRQPNTRIARSHISCRLTVRVEDTKFELLEYKIEFLQWWRKNHGLMAQFITLSVIYTTSID